MEQETIGGSESAYNCNESLLRQISVGFVCRVPILWGPLASLKKIQKSLKDVASLQKDFNRVVIDHSV